MKSSLLSHPSQIETLCAVEKMNMPRARSCTGQGLLQDILQRVQSFQSRAPTIRPTVLVVHTPRVRPLLCLSHTSHSTRPPLQQLHLQHQPSRPTTLSPSRPPLPCLYRSSTRAMHHRPKRPFLSLLCSQSQRCTWYSEPTLPPHPFLGRLWITDRCAALPRQSWSTIQPLGHL